MVATEQQGRHQFLHVQELPGGVKWSAQGGHARAVQHRKHREEGPEDQRHGLFVRMPWAGMT